MLELVVLELVVLELVVLELEVLAVLLASVVDVVEAVPGSLPDVVVPAPEPPGDAEDDAAGELWLAVAASSACAAESRASAMPA
ncbi:hypothetical protein [Blastococcus sp. PRF04-17]|uniref:hypothetical protein n=1 Tax=Blastococcus sp. PRF04-17 TaxID=2933797 RepID=UPI001FF48EFB|nr:hypothetical protein [Blastococcus sp. PRF04-17]UOY00487.1 hypothetical protein MVA48_15980 [Blastococcus sp. PRF04-17]